MRNVKFSSLAIESALQSEDGGDGHVAERSSEDVALKPAWNVTAGDNSLDEYQIRIYPVNFLVKPVAPAACNHCAEMNRDVRCRQQKLIYF